MNDGLMLLYYFAKNRVGREERERVTAGLKIQGHQSFLQPFIFRHELPRLLLSCASATH